MNDKSFSIKKKRGWEQILQKDAVVWLGAMFCCALWGSAFPCVKLGYELFQISSADIAAQILFAGMRFTLAGVLAVLFGSLLSRKLLLPKKESVTKILCLCLMQTVVQYLFFYIGLARTSGVKASIIEAVSVFVAVFVASVIFHQEKLSAAKLIGCLVGFAGVLLVNVTKSGLDMNISFLGEGFILLSTVAYAFSSVLIKRYSEEENPVVLSGYQFLAGGVILMAVGTVFGGKVSGFSPVSLAMLLYLAFISAAAYSVWGILLKYNPVSKVAVFGFMNPVFGVILSALLLGEKEQAFGVKTIAALLLVGVGIYIVNRKWKKKEEEQ